MQYRITVDLGPELHAALLAYSRDFGSRPSDEVRKALAKHLKMKCPVLRGQVKNLKQYRHSGGKGGSAS